MSRNFLDLDIETGVDNGRLLAMLAAHGEVLGKEYHNGSVTVHCRLPSRHFGKLVGARRHDPAARR